MVLIIVWCALPFHRLHPLSDNSKWQGVMLRGVCSNIFARILASGLHISRAHREMILFQGEVHNAFQMVNQRHSSITGFAVYYIVYCTELLRRGSKQPSQVHEAQG